MIRAAASGWRTASSLRNDTLAALQLASRQGHARDDTKESTCEPLFQQPAKARGPIELGETRPIAHVVTTSAQFFRATF
jgi:hypothetical protein